MKSIYRDITNSPEFEAAAYQMQQAGFPAVDIEDTIINEQDFREYSEAEQARAIDAIHTVVARHF